MKKSKTVRTDDGEHGGATECIYFLNYCYLPAIVAFLNMPQLIVVHRAVCMYCKLRQWKLEELPDSSTSSIFEGF